MRRFLLFLVLIVVIIGCQMKKSPPELKISPHSLAKIEGPKPTIKNDTLSLIIYTIEIVNQFKEGIYGIFYTLNDIKNQMGEYKYSNGTWTWEIKYLYVTIYKITCTESRDGYIWRIYYNSDSLFFEGFISEDGDYAYWKFFSSDTVSFSMEFEDRSSGGYYKLYNGDLNSTLLFWIDWTTTSNYCEVTFHIVGTMKWEYIIREYKDHHGTASIKENGNIIFTVNWDSNGNITK